MSSGDRVTRFSYEESCKLLQSIGQADAGSDGEILPIPDHLPQYDDEEPGVSFFRTLVAEVELEHLTLPRTFFGRSEIGPISFRNTNLFESNLCWNDFIEVNFEEADLSGSDLRASNFNKVRFVKTKLRGADLRLASFESCDFTYADMHGAKLTREQGARLRLTDEQKKAIDWQENDGEAPPGG
jgi:hypothetical protein